MIYKYRFVVFSFFLSFCSKSSSLHRISGIELLSYIYMYISKRTRTVGYFMEQLSGNEGVYMQTRRRLAEP